MLDIKNYLDKKTSGLAIIAAIGDAYAIAVKKFDPNTGDALPDDVQAINLDDLNNQVADLQSQIDDLNQVIADCQACQPTPVPTPPNQIK